MQIGGANASQCANGHIGPFCGICKDGWSMGSGSRCVECSTDGALRSALSNPMFWAMACGSALTLIGSTALLFTALVYREGTRLFISAVRETVSKVKDGVMSKVKVTVAFFQCV